MIKLTSWGFQNICSFRVLKVLNKSYWLSKSGQNWRKNSKERRRQKNKDTTTILSSGLCHGISVGPIWLVPRWFRDRAENSKLWPCLFLVLFLLDFNWNAPISRFLDFWINLPRFEISLDLHFHPDSLHYIASQCQITILDFWINCLKYPQICISTQLIVDQWFLDQFAWIWNFLQLIGGGPLIVTEEKDWVCSIL